MTDKADITGERDRPARERAIVAAAKALLAAEGFGGFGINAIARAAGCDKQLIYRYFGGLEGVVQAIGQEIAAQIDSSMTAAAEALGPADGPRSYAQTVETLLLAYLEALRSDPLTRAVAAWEVAVSSPLVKVLADARSMALQRWSARWLKGAAPPPAGLDAPAINVILIAGLQHLVLAAATTGAFAGVAFSDDASWERIRQALSRLVRGSLGST